MRHFDRAHIPGGGRSRGSEGDIPSVTSHEPVFIPGLFWTFDLIDMSFLRFPYAPTSVVSPTSGKRFSSVNMIQCVRLGVPSVLWTAARITQHKAIIEPSIFFLGATLLQSAHIIRHNAGMPPSLANIPRRVIVVWLRVEFGCKILRSINSWTSSRTATFQRIVELSSADLIALRSALFPN